MEDPEVTAWLADLGLERYSAAFGEAQVDFATLADLTAADLRELGISAVGPRRRLENAIGRLRVARGESEKATAPIEARRHLTILFCDVVGSTALSRRCDAEQMSVMFREYYSVVTRVVKRRGGHEANRLGDGSLIFFGYPHAHEHAALQAVLTAREIVDETARVVSDPEGNPICVRAGIASGMVVLNHADTKNVFGDTPNIAARVQALAAPGEVLVAESTRRLLRDLVRLAAQGEHTLKGIAEPMRVWRVLRDDERQEESDTKRTPAVPLIGRRAELERLTELWNAVRSGHGHCVYITGEAGIGKSHLATVFAESVASEGGRRTLFSCSPESVDSPFSPFLREARARADESDAIDPELAAALREPELTESLNLSRDRRESLIGGFVRRALAADEGLATLLCFEDAHWSDPSSLEVLARIVAAADHHQVLVLITTREPDGVPGIEGGTVLPLLPLGAEDCKRVVAATIDALDVATPDHLIAEIASRADGVPFFAEELALSFAQASAARSDAVASIADVPASLHEALQYRIDGLEVGAEVLRLAAAFGRELSMDVLRELVPNARLLSDAMTELSAAGLLSLAPSELVGSSDSLVFRHQLVLEYAYDTIMRRDRVELHARIADVLAPRLDSDPETRAYHEERAGRIETAARCWAEAGKRAASRSADAEAATYFRRALALVPQFSDVQSSEEFEIEVLLAFLPTLMSSDGYVSAAGASVNRVVELTAKRSQADQAFNALFLRWLSQLGHGNVDIAHGLGLELKGLADEISTEVASLLIDRMMGTTHMFRGELAAASEALERFATLYRADRHAAALAQYGATDNYTTVQCCRICVAVLVGDLEPSRALQDSTVAEAEELGRIHNLCHVLAYGGAIGSLLRQDWKASTRYLNRLDELASAHQLPFWETAVHFLRGIEAAHDGDLRRGHAIFERAVQWFTANGAGFLLPTFRVLFASAAGAGSHDRFELARIDDTLDAGERWLRAELLRLRAREDLRNGHAEEGLALLDRSIRLAQEQGAVILVERASSLLEQADALLAMAATHASRGRSFSL
jgi:class 3 adenylate cyclase/tetratricopeptide (TPR) repeat protein